MSKSQQPLGQSRKADQVLHKYWQFTYNNVDIENGLEEPFEWFDAHKKPVYCVWQLEMGEEGTFHLQGYVVFDTRVSLAYIRKFGQCHWTPCNGNHSACVAYCTKQDETYCEGPWSYGVCPEDSFSGKRNDLIAFRDAVADGMSTKDIILDDALVVSYIKYPHFVQNARLALSDGRSEQTNGMILWGPPGTGKTTEAYRICAALGYSVFPLPQKQTGSANHWWDGYNHHQAVIVDEASGSDFKASFFCQLLGEKPLIVPTKNGHASFDAKLIIFTSNICPTKWYKPEVMASSTGLQRRFTPPIMAIKKMFTLVTLPLKPFPEAMSLAIAHLQDDTTSFPASSVVQQEVQRVMTDDGLHYSESVVDEYTGLRAYDL